MKKNIRLKLKKPKITFNQFKQIAFTLKNVLKIIFSVKPGTTIVILVLNSFIGVSSIIYFYFEKLILDNIVKALGSDDPLSYVGVLVYLILAIMLVNFLRNISFSITGFLRFYLARFFELELDLRISESVSKLDIVTLDDPEFKNKLNKIERESGRRAWQMLMPISSMASSVFGFVSAVGVTYLIHPLIPLVIIAISLPRILVNRNYIKKQYQLDSELSPNSRKQGWIRSYLITNRSFLEQKILGISDYLLDQMRLLGRNFVESKVYLHKKQEVARAWTIIPITIFETLVSVVLIKWVLIKRITVGSFQLFLRSLRSASDNLSEFAASLLSIYENYTYMTDLVWLFDLEPNIKDGVGRKEFSLIDGIKFDNVWFKYRKGLPWILRGINVEIKPGEKIAIVGENGAGKSTLIKLISRFYDPNKGGVKISNINLNEIDTVNWRKRLSILLQDFQTYPFSVRETVGYGDIGRIDDTKSIMKTLKKVGIDGFVNDLPLKLDNPLAPEFEKGVNPSAGQWQRLGLARMLFRSGTEILILDEPTSNVDPEAEENIFKELTKISKNKILIFVTQRFSTVRIADRILVMDKGKIIEQGTHKELMDIDGKYARLFKLQAKAYLEG